MTLFSYTVRYDYGSAPNPFWDLCTLTICKPVVRRNAGVGDWIAGLRGDSLVYAMRVTDVKTLAEYDQYCRTQLQAKIPKWHSRNYRLRVGDCIYDYSSFPPLQRPGIHQEENVQSDLSGLNAPLSNDFYYFGSKPIPLPSNLRKIVHKRGHKSQANDPYKAKFVRWIRRFHHARNRVVAEPELKNEVTPACRSKCARRDRQEAESDERQIRGGRC
jgi:hypothetical protein